MHSNKKGTHSLVGEFISVIGLLASALLKAADTAGLFSGHDRVVSITDVTLVFLPDKESWLVDELVLESDVAVVDEGAGVVVGLSELALENLGLETAGKKIGGGKGKDIIEFLLGLIENAEAGKAAEEGSTFEHALAIVLWKHEKFTGSLADLGKGIVDAPEFTLVLETEFTDGLEFVVDAFLFVWTTWFLEGNREATAGHSLERVRPF